MLEKIIKEIKKAEKIAMFHHVNPDGDSFSSSYGLMLALKKRFPEKLVVLVANEYEIKKRFPFWDVKSENIVPKIDDSFLAIVGDVSVAERIAHFDEFDKAHKKIVFDHHKMPLEPNFKHDIYWREENFPASAMQAFMIAKKLGVKLDAEVAFALMVGLVTDSGHFTYSANDTKILKIYIELLEHSSEQKMMEFFNGLKIKTPDDLELSKEILKKVKYSKSVSYAVFDKEFVQKYTKEKIKNKINIIGYIQNYPVWAMFLEKEAPVDGFEYDVSLRSNAHSILKVAQKYHGGGHDRASGCKLENLAAIKKFLADLDDLYII